MNKNIKTLLNVLPIILIPLFTERKHIKEHPDIERLGHFSSNTYHNVKDKGEGAYQSVKATGSNVYQTGKSAVDTVGSKINDKRQARSYKKDMQSYQRTIRKEDKLLEQFEKDKEKHRSKRLENEASDKPKVPKIMQSNPAMSNEDKMAGMTVSEHLIMDVSKIDPQTEAALETNVDNQDIAKAYDDNQTLSRVSLSKKDEERLDIQNDEHTEDDNNDRMDTDQSNDEEINMTQDVQQLYFDKVKNHEDNIEDFESKDLFKKHHSTLDYTVNYDTDENVSPAEDDNAEKTLFDKHREQAEQYYDEHGRKSGIRKNIRKNKKQQKLEKKLNKKRQQF